MRKLLFFVVLLKVFYFKSIFAGGIELFDPSFSQGKKFKVFRFPHSTSKIIVSFPFALKEVNRAHDRFIHQGEIVVLGPHNLEVQALFTLPLRPCIAVAIFNPHNNRALLAHVGAPDDLDTLKPFFNQLDVKPDQLDDVQVTLFTQQFHSFNPDARKKQRLRLAEIGRYIQYQFDIDAVRVRSVMYIDCRIFEYGQYDAARSSFGINRIGELFHTAAREYVESLFLEQPQPIVGADFWLSGKAAMKELQNQGLLDTSLDCQEYLLSLKRGLYIYDTLKRYQVRNSKTAPPVVSNAATQGISQTTTSGSSANQDHLSHADRGDIRNDIPSSQVETADLATDEENVVQTTEVGWGRNPQALHLLILLFLSGIPLVG